ncbi:MAG: hypothetical protein J7518_05660 [Nocardioidaceae bacterium]|nr:hypothetical protein [Nocardioidaceae bacterium]
MLSRCVCALGLVLAGLCLGAGPADAESTDGGLLVVDGTTVKASEADDGGYEATVTLINTGTAPVTIEGVTVPGCTTDVKDGTVAGLQSAEVKLELDEACFKDAAKVKATLGEGLPAVTVTKPAGGSDWKPLWIGVLAGLALGVAVWFAGQHMVGKVDKLRKQAPEDAADRQAKYEKLKNLVSVRVAALNPSDPQILQWKPTLPLPTDDFGMDSEIKGLEAGWSFKDSWAANLTVATTALVALVNSADTLKAVLGEEPKAALGVMTVAGLLSALVIAVANTVAKLVGDSTAQVTAKGLVLSTSMVVFAAGLQTVTVGGSALSLVDGVVLGGVVVVIALAVVVVLLWYAFRSLWGTLATGADDPVPALPADALTAWEAEQPWQKAIVHDRIVTLYARWLTDVPATATAEPAYPWPPRTSPGDEPLFLPRRSSLI